MSKYATILSDVETQFSTTTWKNNKIKTYPVNFVVPSNISEFVKIEILPLNSNIDYGRFGIEGQIIIQIYVKANQGSKRLMEIADLLDNILQNKDLGIGTKTSESSLSVLGLDRDNPELFRGDYTLDFKYFN